jgi:hypothetical protein
LPTVHIRQAFDTPSSIWPLQLSSIAVARLGRRGRLRDDVDERLLDGVRVRQGHEDRLPGAPAAAIAFAVVLSAVLRPMSVRM